MLLFKTNKEFKGDFGLRDQITRSVVSIPSNIAEGNDRESQQEFLRYLIIARGSLAEVQTQLFIAKEIGYIRDEQYIQVFAFSIEIQKMLNSLITSTRKKTELK